MSKKGALLCAAMVVAYATPLHAQQSQAEPAAGNG